MINTIAIDGWPIEYVESGDPSRPPMVMLHGWAQDHRLFGRIEPYLAENYRVLRVNFRGHDAKLTDLGDFTARDLAGDVVALIERLGLRDVRLVSTSHGCWVNIDVHERLGAASLGRTVVIDWLMRPFEGFHRQIREGHEPETVVAARQSLFDEWTEGTDCLEVIDHVNREMTWFGERMWMRACREIERSYAEWGDPLRRMSALADRLRVLHVYSQPLDPGYRAYQEEFSREHPWFAPVHIPGQTHFPTLENPAAVAGAVRDFYA
ncbi:alpha/beta fold hydrolase [Pseudonocardia acaciae]|uniref:alpha/beta fold hydrolase n=1 Tax=Pseudonocardia acaciae TaxID=551276 RepID=UPI00048F301C|nr:alpha/beta hydrolase [Pseudonocardia acaciae]